MVAAQEMYQRGSSVVRQIGTAALLVLGFIVLYLGYSEKTGKPVFGALLGGAPSAHADALDCAAASGASDSAGSGCGDSGSGCGGDCGDSGGGE